MDKLTLDSEYYDRKNILEALLINIFIGLLYCLTIFPPLIYCLHIITKFIQKKRKKSTSAIFLL